jgi:hypothetical protein
MPVAAALLALPGGAVAGPTDPGGVCTVPKKLGMVFVVDDSGSMADNDPNALRGAATDIGIAQLPDGAVAAVSRFSDVAQTIFNPAELNPASRAASRQAVGSALASSGGTDYDEAFAEAKRQLDAMQGVDRRAVVFLSDGEPNFAYTADQPIAAAGIPIFTLGFAQAPPAELAGIAQRSGGQSFFVQSVDQAQAVFARIASILNCDVQNTTSEVSLKPGQSKTYRFDVQDGDRAFKALASWVGGGVSVSLTRPDGSVLAPGSEREGETFDAQPTYASVTGVDPPVGPWKLTVSASDENVSRVHVNIDTFQRLPPGTQASEDTEGPPQSSGGPGCQARITAGPIEAVASCFRKQGRKYIAQGRVRLNGIDLAPASGEVNIVVDTDKLELRTSGSVEARVGPVVIYRGSIDRSLRAEFSLAVPGDATLKGFPVKGDAKVNFEDGHAQLTLNAALPALLGGVTGSATVRATNDAGLDLRNLKLTIPEFRVRVVPVKNVSVAYSKTADGDRWEGGATVGLPGPRPVEMTGSAAFLNGAFAEAAGSVSGINAPFGGFVFLDKVSGSLRVQPDFAFSGGIGLTAGPRIPVLDAAAAALDGTFSFQQGPPDTYSLGGDLKLAEVSLASANASYRTDGLFNFSGKLDFSKAGFGLQSDLSGFVSGGGFNAEGSGTIKTPGPDVDGKGLISDRGIAGCGSVGAWVLKVEAGFGYHWGDFAPTPFTGCDLGDYRSKASAGRAAQALGPGASTTVRLRSGMRVAAFAVSGADAPPSVTLTEPGGRTIGVPGEVYATTPDAVTLRYAPRITTYVLVRQPRGGTWTVSVDEGSSAVTGVAVADGLAAPGVAARVRGGGAARVLSWRARRIAGQRIAFSEVGAGLQRFLGATSRSRGRLRFTPADGPRGARLIVATVEQDGMPRSSTFVARYRASGVVRPGRPGRLRGTRRGSRAVFAWGGAARAAAYDVTVSVTDGRRLRLTRTSRRLVVGRLFKRDRVRVTVRARTKAGRLGRARSARA